MPELNRKLIKLADILRRAERVAIAFSGGVDSTFLLKYAFDTLGRENTLAITVDAPVHLRFELVHAEKIAREIGVRHIMLKTGMEQIPGLDDNPPDRCYICKKALLDLCISNIPKGWQLAEGSNLDDLSAHRPGRKAVSEAGVASPLSEAGLTKQELRVASRIAGLETWDKPPQSCLLTRFPHNEKISSERLDLAQRGEALIAGLGLPGSRIRIYGKRARVEIQQNYLEKAVEEPLRSLIIKGLEQTGFCPVEIDLAGYRSGSMDES